MVVSHNSHYIDARAEQQPDGLWKARVLVTAARPPCTPAKLLMQQVFATERESEEWGVALGKQWIDNGKLPL